MGAEQEASKELGEEHAAAVATAAGWGSDAGVSASGCAAASTGATAGVTAGAGTGGGGAVKMRRSRSESAKTGASTKSLLSVKIFVGISPVRQFRLKFSAMSSPSMLQIELVGDVSGEIVVT